MYRYRVFVNGQEWGVGPLRDWDEPHQTMRPTSFAYDNRFRTFPDTATPPPALTFAILGDFGRGVRKPSDDDICQREAAEAMYQAFQEHDIRLILTTGDNIYHDAKRGSGKEDDDWFYTYFQPYRYLINRVPVFPAAGNHDDGEVPWESTDDRRQLYDNFYIKDRFAHLIEAGEASLEPGLFYRFRYGADIEFICLDTAKQSWLFSKRYFRHPNHRPRSSRRPPDLHLVQAEALEN